jgi:Rad3-related DNA helicase
VDIRGQQNYTCDGLDQQKLALYRLGRHPGQMNFRTAYSEAPTCQDGREIGCSNKVGRNWPGCPYWEQYQKALRSRLVVTNYSYWFAINMWGSGLGKFDCIVLDEAHAAPDEVSSALTVEIDDWERQKLLRSVPWPLKTDKIVAWAGWAKTHKHIIEARLGEQLDFRERKRYSQMFNKLSILSVADGKVPWVCEPIVPKHRRDTRTGWKMEPLWPGPYCEQVLFRGTEKVILCSATVRPKTLELLGLKEDDYDYLEYDSPFPVRNRPVIWIPTIRNDYRATDIMLRWWIKRIDEIIDVELAAKKTVKGLIHAVSYKRADLIRWNSRHAGLFIWHNGAYDQADAIDKLKKSKGPAVLLSPTITTGVDFPGDDAEFQIIGKIPFASTHDSKIVAARHAADKEYGQYQAMLDIMQMAGRIVRSETDIGRTYIIDDHWGEWFKRRARRHAQKWFLRSCTDSNSVPKIQRRRS